MNLRLLLSLVASTLIVGCTPRAGQDLPQYGDTVRHVMDAQTWQPGNQPPPVLHGDRAARTMDAYRAAGAPAAPAPTPR